MVDCAVVPLHGGGVEGVVEVLKARSPVFVSDALGRATEGGRPLPLATETSRLIIGDVLVRALL